MRLRLTPITIIVLVFVILAAGGIVWAMLGPSSTTPGQYDALAQCLTQKGATFYGASWCSHCKDQKDAFGSSMKYVTYVECAEAGRPNVQTQACVDAKVESYPTWIFADGSRLSGVQDFSTLADKTGCTLP